MALNYAKKVKALKRGKNLAGRLRRYFFLLLAAFIVLILGSSYLYWKLERGGEGTMSEAVWTILFTLIGQGEFASNPTTLVGRIIIFLLSIVGISLLGVVLSEFLTRVMQYNLKAALGLNSCRYEHHTIICGWNTHASLVLRELLAAGRKCAVIAESKPAELTLRDAFFISGDPSDEEVLKKAGAEKADTAIILAQPQAGLSADDIDARTILTALAVETLRHEIYSVVELINRENAAHARHANADDIVFCSTVIADLAALSASQPGIISFIDDLFTGTGGSRFCTEEAGYEWEGRTVGELFEAVRARGDLPIGIIFSDGSYSVDPAPGRAISLPMRTAYITRLTPVPDTEQIESDEPSSPLFKRTVLCGWNRHAMRIVNELTVSGDDVTVLTRTFPNELEGSGVHVITAESSDSTALQTAELLGADSVIVLATNYETLPAGTVDAKSILTTLAIEKMHPRIHSVVEILKPENARHAENAGADSIILCEHILARYLALCGSQPGISGIINEIFSHCAGETAISTIDLSPSSGSTIGEAFGRLRTAGALPLAVMFKVHKGNRERWAHVTHPGADMPVRLPMKAICITPSPRRE